MSKQVTKKEKNEVGQPLDMEAWGGSPITSQDITLPRIVMMQPMADKVTEGKAAFGEFRESLNNEKLGDFNSPMEVLPFYLQKVFIEYDVTDPKEKNFYQIVPITSQNDDLPYEGEGVNSEGKKIKIERDRCMNYYVLLPKEIDEGRALPYVITFRRTSLRAGKKLATQMYVKNRDAGLPPPAVLCEISANRESNDKGTYGVMDVTFTTRAKDEHVEKCKGWIKTILAGQAKVDESSFSEEVKTTSKKAERDVTEEPDNF